MPKKMILDIETLPADETKIEQLRYLYEKKKSKSAAENEEDFDDFFRKTSFDGAFGRILCIAFAVNDGPVEVLCNPDDEKKTLQQFWGIAREIDVFVGHNVMDFDLRFIYQRSMMLGVYPSKDISFARYRNFPIFDTMKEWVKWSNSSIGLEALALAFGLPTPKEGIDGSQVYDFFLAGKVDEICEYCKRDVETTRSVYKKMIFEE